MALTCIKVDSTARRSRYRRCNMQDEKRGNPGVLMYVSWMVLTLFWHQGTVPQIKSNPAAREQQQKVFLTKKKFNGIQSNSIATVVRTSLQRRLGYAGRNMMTPVVWGVYVKMLWNSVIIYIYTLFCLSLGKLLTCGVIRSYNWFFEASSPIPMQRQT